MKKLLIVLAFLSIFLLSGCLPSWVAPEPVPEIPEPVMKANVDAVLVVDEEVNYIAWSIENIGDVNIFKYIITFNVLYPVKDNVILAVEGYALGIGKKYESILELAPYGEEVPGTVSVSWELFN